MCRCEQCVYVKARHPQGSLYVAGVVHVVRCSTCVYVHVLQVPFFGSDTLSQAPCVLVARTLCTLVAMTLTDKVMVSPYTFSRAHSHTTQQFDSTLGWATLRHCILAPIVAVLLQVRDVKLLSSCATFVVPRLVPLAFRCY